MIYVHENVYSILSDDEFFKNKIFSEHKSYYLIFESCFTSVLIIEIIENSHKVTKEKITANHKDVEAFLNATKAYEENGLYVIPNNTNIKLYFKEIVI